MKKKTKALIGLIVMFVIFAGIGYYFQQKGNENLKHITIEVISKRDNYEKTHDVKTEKENLGDVLKETKIVDKYEDSQYGMYIKSVDGLADDVTQQYWWAILVNGESATSGADALVLEDEAKYTLELKQGY